MTRTRTHIAFLPLSRFTLAAFALTCAGPTLAQNVQDFQLPSNPTPTPTGPAVQGPVDNSGIIPQGPRAVNTPRPTPRVTATPAPSPTPTATPGTVEQPRPLPRVTNTPSPLPRAPQERSVVGGPLDSPSPQVLPTGQPTTDPATSLSLPTPSTPSATAQETAEALEEEGAWPWPWLLLAVVAALGLGWFIRRRKSENAPPPVIEKPVVGEVSARSVTAPASGKPIAIKAEAVKLSRSMMNATLHYRLTLTNRTSSVLTNLAIGGDLVSARNGTPIERQVADSATDLQPRHEIKRMSPGQTLDLTGTMQLPLSEVQAIRRGASALFVPLMRWRAANGAIDPVSRTFVVGMQPQAAGGKLQPFRLDEQPQTYAQISQRALD